MNRTAVVFAAFILLWGPAISSALTLRVDPAVGEFGPGDTFIATLRVDVDGECINAAHVSISYPPDRLRATDFGKGESIFSLWAEEPVLNTENGVVTFSGGVPGGYCGRVQGDIAQSNVVSKIVFTVLRSSAAEAGISIDPVTAVYLNDGLGTRAEVDLKGSTITIAPEARTTVDPWLNEVRADSVPPEPFRIGVQTYEGLFGGRYFAAFSTVDKQSGIDHYEIFERGAWVPVTSPHKIANQSLRGGVQIKAVDKAGNERLGEYDAGSVPAQPQPRYDLLSGFALLLLIAIAVIAKRHLDRQRAAEEVGV